MEKQAVQLFRPMRLEAWIEGVPASTSLICGPAGYEVLPPTRQVFRSQPMGAYVGNQDDLSKDHQSRAHNLACRVADALPPTCGYLGIDMILGATPGEDRVVEINPRLTSSYSLLRKLRSDNLAETMLSCAIT